MSTFLGRGKSAIQNRNTKQNYTDKTYTFSCYTKIQRSFHKFERKVLSDFFLIATCRTELSGIRIGTTPYFYLNCFCFDIEQP